MSGYHIEPLDRKYNAEILDILGSAHIVTKRLSITFDRGPDFFRLPDIKYDKYRYYGFFDSGHLKGFCGIGYFDALVNGQETTVYQLRDYYMTPEARGKALGLRLAAKFFGNYQEHPVIGFVMIMTGNEASLHYVDHRYAKFPFMPFSRILNQLDVRNILLSLPVRLSEKYKIRPATQNDIPEIVALLNEEHKERLFGNSYDIDGFLEDLNKKQGLSIGDYYIAENKKGAPCGVCAAWDCTSFRQTKIYHYGKHFLPARIFYRSLSAFCHLPPLPFPGEGFKEITVTDYAAGNRDPAIMNALLLFIYNKFRRLGYHLINWGSSIDDPLLKATRGLFHQRFISNIILVSTKPEMLEHGAVKNYLPYIDLPCL